MTYEDNPWIYNDVPYTSDDVTENESYGFVYIIINNITGQKYIGKKFFWSKRRLPPLKGKTRKRIVVKESDWKKYWGSSKILKAEYAKYGQENFSREILSIHPDKRETNFAELSLQIHLNVLDSVDEDGLRLYYNENIDRIYYPSKKHGEERLRLSAIYKSM